LTDSSKEKMTLVLLGLLTLVFIVVFLPTWQSLFKTWSSSDDYSHGFLIVPLSVYLVWQKKEEYQSEFIKPSWISFPLVLLSLLLYLLAQFAEISTLSSLAMIIFIVASLLFLCGFRVLKLSAFPLFLLVFMVPVPAQIYASLTIPLQLFVTKMTVLIASSMGIPIIHEGNVLSLPEHTLQVVQACSGLRSIMTLMTLGVVIAYFSLKSNVLRTILFLFAIPIAVLVNIIRVLAMVVAFYYYNYDLTGGTIHTVFGTIIFGLALIFFILVRKGLVLCEK